MYSGAGKYPIEAIYKPDIDKQPTILSSSTLTENTNTIDLSSLSLSSLTVDTFDLSSYSDMTLHDIDSGDITLEVNGETRSVAELFTSMDAIEKRLNILRPNPELLEKYELLQSLYEQYKAAEAMLYGDDADE